jgi:S1-C subfamily serine protease
MTEKETFDNKENKFDKPDEDEQILLELTRLSSEESESEENSKKFTKSAIRFFAFFISVVLVITILGNIFSDVNIYSIKFLANSYKLSRDKKIQEWKKSVAMVSTQSSSGTGFAVSPTGDIITNSHVIKGATNIHINFPFINSFEAKKWDDFPEADLAILKIEKGTNLPLLPLETKIEPKAGDKVTVIGNPMRFFNVVSIGKVLGYKNLNDIDIPVLMINVPIYKGSSGSPVINENGSVIGVIFATSDYTNTDEKDIIGFAIPSKEILSRIR